MPLPPILPPRSQSPTLRLLLLLAAGLLACAPARADEVDWSSPLLGRTLRMQLLEPAATPAAATPSVVPLVFYLQNLAAPRPGTEADEPIIRDLRASGHLVALLDYGHDPRARGAGLYQDLVALRRQLQQRTLLPGRPVDRMHSFIVPAGCRLARDVVFYRDAGRVLAMDIIYPARPAQPVGAVLEFSCDNTNRMGNYSLDYCSDALLPLAASEGLMAVMADHPVAPPYEGLDAMPDSAWKAKAAVRTLRAEGAALGLNGRIVPAGFSRGSGIALLLATTPGRPEFEGRGEHSAADSTVQGAIVMSGRFTYLDLRADDHMLPRYAAAWGDRAAHEAVWRIHGTLDYLQAPAVPLFLTINATETPDALHQMEVLRRRLTALKSPFAYHPETEPRGHRMPLAPDVLSPLLGYLQRQLTVAPEASATPTPK